MSWFANAVPKQICRFLLNRYLGELLLEKVTVEQLSIDLVNGTGSLEDVYLDVQHINEALHKSDLPFELVEGFIGHISIQIPYARLLNDSCVINLGGLELTLQPKPKCQTTDFVSSMIESVIGSMTTSIDLARSFVEEQSPDNTFDEKLHGIDALAQLIQIILSRMKINVNNTIIRLEHFQSDQNTGIALEAQIEKIEFVDECVEAQGPQNNDPITDQPHLSASNVFPTGGDLSKIVRLYGVKLYTDIFNRPSDGCMLNSLVVRRKASEASSLSHHANMIDGSFLDSQIQLNEKSVYKSCYSHEKPAGCNNENLSSNSSSMHSESSGLGDDFGQKNGDDPMKGTQITSRPIQFAEFASERLILRIKIKNSPLGSEGSFKKDEVDLELFLGSLSIFLTPSQIHVLVEMAKCLFDEDSSSLNNFDETKTGKPMQDDDYTKVEMELRRKLEEQKFNSAATSCFNTADAFSGGNWSGSDKFYRSTKSTWKHNMPRFTTDDETEFISIPMSSMNDAATCKDFSLKTDDYRPSCTSDGRKMYSVKSKSRRSGSLRSGALSIDSSKPETSRCKICISQLYIVLSHNDPFSHNSNIVNAVSTVVGWTKTFFAASSQLKLAGCANLKEVFKTMQPAFDNDHVMLVSAPVVIEWLRIGADSVQLNLTANSFSLMECLFQKSANNSTARQSNRGGKKLESPILAEYFELITFDKSAERNVEEPDLKIQFSTENQQIYTCNVRLNKCTLDLDVSIIDRLYSLLFCQPPFSFMKKSSTQKLQQINMMWTKQLFEVPNDSGSPQINHWDDIPNRQQDQTEKVSCSVDLHCPDLLINLRIPIPDLRPMDIVDRSPWWSRKVRGDYLSIDLHNVSVNSTLTENTTKLGEVALKFHKATAYFHDETRRQPLKVLHAFGQENDPCCIELKWDFVNRSLILGQTNDEEADSNAAFSSDYPSCSSNTNNNANANKSGADRSCENEVLASLERNCFKLAQQLEGPFSKKHVSHENEQLTIVGSRKECRDFRKQCLKQCALGLNLRLPNVRFFIPDKELYELFYNRIINDLSLWEPSNPGFQGCFRRGDFGVGQDLLASSDIWLSTAWANGKFTMCKSQHKFDDSDSGSESTIKSSSMYNNTGPATKSQNKWRKGLHKFSFLLQCGAIDSMIVLADEQYDVPLSNEQNDQSIDLSKIRIQAENTEVFLVYGYDNDDHVSYFYITSDTASLKHHDGALGKHNVDMSDFANDIDWLIIAEPTPEHLAVRASNDDNFSMAVRLVLQPKENIKEFLLTFGFRNSTLHYRQEKNALSSLPNENFWLMQLVKFFDVVDYPVVGFEAPKVINDIHVHAWNLAVQYKPDSLPLVLRLNVDSLDISTNIVQEASMFRFNVIVEDFSLFLSDKVRPFRSNPGNNPQNSKLPTKSPIYELPTNLTDFLCLLKMGFFQLVLINHEPPLLEDAEFAHEFESVLKKPLQEISMQNDLLEIKVCYDSLAALCSILKTLAAENHIENQADANYENGSLENGVINEVDDLIRQDLGVPSDDDRLSLASLMTSAMEDIETSVSNSKHGCSSTAMTSSSCTLKAASSNGSSSRGASNSSQAPSASNGAKSNAKTSTQAPAGRGQRSSRNANAATARNLKSAMRQKDAAAMRNDDTGKNVLHRSGPSSMTNTDLSAPEVKFLDQQQQQDDRSNGITIVDNHFDPPTRRTDMLTKLPNGYPVPLLQYLIRDFTISLCFYGGHDFEKSGSFGTKNYSGLIMAQQTPKLRQKINEARRHPFTCGGRHRDQSIMVELFLNKLCFLHELYPPDFPQIARQVVTVQEVQIRDNLLVSSINKLLYLHTTDDKPRPTYTPMICVKLLQFRPESDETHFDNECSLKISIQPIRLHIDQDTLQFMIDFGKDVGDFSIDGNANNLALMKRRRTTSNSMPVISVPRSPMKDDESVTSEKSRRISETSSLGSTPPNSGGAVRFSFDNATNANRRLRTTSQCSQRSDASDASSLARRQAALAGGMYFKSVVFSPAVDIKLDYCGKHIHLDQQQGTVPSLLLGLSQLHSAQIRLKELHHRHGLLGFDKVVNYAANEWICDIRRNQMYSIVGGVSPVHTLLQVSQGFLDLFWMPVDQFKKDGHVVKGIQRGAQSFGLSTASAALEISQKLVGAVQSVAEFAFDIVNPEYPPKPNDLMQGLVQPCDFREGVHMACATFYRGFQETADALTLATQEERARGRWVIRGVLRQATPTILRPLVVTTRATAHILGGLRNQLRPDSWREERNKFKNTE